ncbi:hypothetical protein ACRAWD_30790 [Caulobacter segnis]
MIRYRSVNRIARVRAGDVDFAWRGTLQAVAAFDDGILQISPELPLAGPPRRQIKSVSPLGPAFRRISTSTALENMPRENWRQGVGNGCLGGGTEFGGDVAGRQKRRRHKERRFDLSKFSAPQPSMSRVTRLI